MRLLADNPSMAFLRREAKDLLEALRESDDKATLADAQRATAEEYGFRTWNDLKVEVDRRRAATPDAPAGLAEALAEGFGLGAVRAPLTPIRYEYMGRRWVLEADRGRFMVCPVFEWITDEQAEVSVDLQERARAVGVRSPVPVRTPERGLVRRVQDQSWRLYDWMELGPMPVEPVPAATARTAGRVLAAVHEIAPKTDRPIQGPWVSEWDRPTTRQWSDLQKRAKAAGVPWAAELAGLSSTIEELSAVTAEAPHEAVVITLRNFTVDSAHLGPGDDLVVVQWDFAGPMSPEWELGTTLMHWTHSGSNLEAVRGLLRGYKERRGHVPSLTLGSFSPAVTGWLTWLLHRAWEAADPEPSEKRDFAERTLREILDDPLTVGRLTTMMEAAR